MSHPTDPTVKVKAATTPTAPASPYDWKQLAAILRGASLAVDATASAVAAADAAIAPEVLLIDQIIKAALDIAARLADGGTDPLATLTRIAAADAAVGGVEAAWSAEMDARFGSASASARSNPALAAFVRDVRAAGVAIPAVVLAQLGVAADAGQDGGPS